jgi:hypothetical protein
LGVVATADKGYGVTRLQKEKAPANGAFSEISGPFLPTKRVRYIVEIYPVILRTAKI